MRELAALLPLLAGFGCAARSAPVAGVPVASAPPLFDGLGTHSRKVVAASAEAQRFFDQGLAFVYAFNHDEAIRAFEQAARLDPGCAMAWWGVAYANGPHINNPGLDEPHARAAFAALGRAKANAKTANPADRALIEALAARYADPSPADRKPLDQAYADAMRKVRSAHPDDPDVGALFAEALMDLRPWDLWTPEGKPQPGTDEVVATLEGVLAGAPRHPLANHLYIHAVEASPTPGRADASADALRDLAPGLGHLLHMPSHIDVRRGRWRKAIEANEKALAADDRYRRIVPQQGFYGIYMAHNHHMLAFAAMMLGQSALALRAIRSMLAGIPPAWVKENAALADGFTAMPIEVLMRFGRWNEVMAEPEPAEYLPIARALWRYARAVALAAQGRAAEARGEQKAFAEARAKVPKEASFGNNAAESLLDVAERFMAGEILVREGKLDEGVAALREAAKREDSLRYDEPPDWIQPVRHALGATLLAAGRAAEAEQVYRDDLARLPGNGWSLHGLAHSLAAQGGSQRAEAAEVEARAREALDQADVIIPSSCFCQPGPPPLPR